MEIGYAMETVTGGNKIRRNYSSVNISIAYAISTAIQLRGAQLPGINGVDTEPKSARANSYAMETVTHKELRKSFKIYYSRCRIHCVPNFPAPHWPYKTP